LTTKPYVIYNGEYYTLKDLKGTSECINQTPSSSSNWWEKFNSFEALYAKVGIIENGTIGSAVYSGNFMFSKEGIDKNGAYSNEYEKFNASSRYSTSNDFRPNICINFNTGQLNVSDMTYSGYISRRCTYITSDNYSNYCTSNGSDQTLDISNAGTLIQIKSLPSGKSTIHLLYDISPSYNTSKFTFTKSSDAVYQKLRSLLGTRIIIVNDTDKEINIKPASDASAVSLSSGALRMFELGFRPINVNNKSTEHYGWNPSDQLYTNVNVTHSAFPKEDNHDILDKEF
jgi:hypothetical protein